MPYKPRGVNRGVQDEKEILERREEEKRKRRAKTKKWCGMIGLTLLEFILCLICFALGYYYYHSIESYRNNYGIRHKPNAARYILEPPAPLTIASVYLTLTYVDLISWQHLRPISYFGWIMVSASGFLLFFLYAGCIILTCNAIHAYIAIIFGCITAIVFLVDLICMLISLKRFPVPYWVMKRKYEKIDQCVCTVDYDPEEHIERPICRCGDHWGEPCTCDDPHTTCGCGAEKSGKAPCECCECAGIKVEEEPTVSAISTMVGDDVIEEVGVNAYSQAQLPMLEGFCSQPTPGRYCIDSYAPAASRNTTTTFSIDPYSVQAAASTISGRKSTMQSQGAFSRKSTIARPATLTTASMMTTQSSRMASPSRATSLAAQSQIGRASSVAPQSTGTNRASKSPSRRGIASPSFAEAARFGGLHDDLTGTLGAPSMTMASHLAINKSRKSTHRKTATTYSVHTTTMDNPEVIRKTFASKSVFLDGSGRKIEKISKSSSDDEFGEAGDYRRSMENKTKKSKKKHYSANPCVSFTQRAADAEIGYMSDSEILREPRRISTLPGQVIGIDERRPSRQHSRKNVSISAKERSCRRSPSVVSITQRPHSVIENLGSPRVIRNVSTTVRAVRTLSRVMEDNESNRGSDGFPSESTITINNKMRRPE